MANRLEGCLSIFMYYWVNWLVSLVGGVVLCKIKVGEASGLGQIGMNVNPVKSMAGADPHDLIST